MAARKKTSEFAPEGGDAPSCSTDAVDEPCDGEGTSRALGKVRVTIRHGCVQADREYTAGESLHLHVTDAEALLALGILEPW
jgi:hypothetical protein